MVFRETDFPAKKKKNGWKKLKRLMNILLSPISEEISERNWMIGGRYMPRRLIGIYG